MSHANFKKEQCPLLLFLQFSCRFKKSLILHVEKGPYVMSVIFFSCRQSPCRMLILRNGNVTQSNLRVKGPHRTWCGVEKHVADI